MIAFLNPPTVHAPGGAYSHSAVVPAGAELIFLSGQVGVRPDGSLPSALVKLTMFVVAGQDIQAVRTARAKFLGAHRPASTAVFVSQLVDPAWHVEVEGFAARSKA